MRSFSFANPLFLALLAPGGPAAPPGPIALPPIDKERFATFVEAGDAQTTPASWYDQSGHGQHFTQPRAVNQAPLTTDEQGYSVYRLRSLDGDFNYWNFSLATPASDYTVYMVLDVADNVYESYIFDAKGHSLLLSPGPAVGLYYSSQFGVRGNVVLPLGKHLVIWNLSEATGGRVFVDNQLLYTGSYTKVSLNGGRLGIDFADVYGAFGGGIYSVALVQGGDSAAQMQTTTTYLKARHGLTF